MGHAGSDVEIGYKSLQEIERIESDDPLLHSARIMIEKRLSHLQKFYPYMKIPENN